MLATKNLKNGWIWDLGQDFLDWSWQFLLRIRIFGEITLVESDKRKCVFLNTVKRELNLNLSIINNRIESCNRQKADVISARALADLPRLLELSFNHLSNNATLIFAKGKSWQEELVAAEKTWNFSWEAVTSITDPKSVVLKIGELSRANQ